MNSFTELCEINTTLCNVVGLDPRLVSAFSLHVSTTEWPRLVVTRFVTELGKPVEEAFVLTKPPAQPQIDFMLLLKADIDALLNDADVDIRRIDVCGEHEIALDLGSSLPYKRMAPTGLQTMRIEIEIYRVPPKRLSAAAPKAEFQIGSHSDGRRWCLPAGMDFTGLTDISLVKDLWSTYIDAAGQRHDCAEYARQAGLVKRKK